MNHRQLYAEACRKAFEGFSIPDSFWEKRARQRGGHWRQWTKEDGEQLIEYCRQGLRSQEIALLTGRSQKAIQKAFVRFGFPRLHNICPPSGSANPAWNGGVHVDPTSGYRFLRVPDHPYANMNGYVREHRLIVEKHLGRFLLPTEVVHHKDGNSANNDIDNLEVFSSNGEHLRATLAGIPHNVSPEGRKRLSEKTKAAWRNGVYTFSAETRRKLAEATKKRWENGDFANRRKKHEPQQSDHQLSDARQVATRTE